MSAAKRKTKKASKPQFIERRAFERFDRNEPISHPAVRLQRENYGWPIFLVRQPSRVIIAAGCRWFTFDQATAHWGDPSSAGLMSGCPCCRESWGRYANMTALLPKLKQRAKRLGWLES